MKTLNNTNFEECKANVPDVQAKGNPDAWQLVCKAWSSEQGWMKSTKAMEIEGVGCLVQVSTQQQGFCEGETDTVAEAVTFVPGVVLVPNENGTVSITKS